MQRELDRARTAQQSQTANAQSLRQALTQSAETVQRTQQDKELLEGELRATRRTATRLEDEVARVTAELRAKEHELKRSEADVQHRLAELVAAQEQLRGRAEALAAAEAAAGGGTGCSNATVARLEAQLIEARRMTEVARRAQQRANEQCATLAARLEERETHCAELGQRESADREELHQLRKQLQEATQCVERCQAKQVAAVPIASSGVAAVEHVATDQRIQQVTGEVERRSAELQLTSAQLEALRLENRLLRQSSHSTTSLSGRDHLRLEIPDAHVREDHETQTTLEGEHIGLAKRLQKVDLAVREATRRAEIAELAANSAARETDQLRAENMALTEFVAGVTGTLTGETLMRETESGSSLALSPQQIALETSQHHGCEIPDNFGECDRSTFRNASLSVVGYRFLEDEEQRSRRLETIINSHIDDLRLQSMSGTGDGSEAGGNSETR